MSSIIVLIRSVIDNSPFRLFLLFSRAFSSTDRRSVRFCLRVTGAVPWLIYWFLQTTDFSVFFVFEHSEQIRTAVGDPDLQIRWGGGGAHSGPEISGEPGRKKLFFGPSGLSLVQKQGRGEAGHPPWIRHWTVNIGVNSLGLISLYPIILS